MDPKAAAMSSAMETWERRRDGRERERERGRDGGREREVKERERVVKEWCRVRRRKWRGKRRWIRSQIGTFLFRKLEMDARGRGKVLLSLATTVLSLELNERHALTGRQEELTSFSAWSGRSARGRVTGANAEAVVKAAMATRRRSMLFVFW